MIGRFRMTLRAQLIVAMVSCVLATVVIATVSSIYLEDMFMTSFSDKLSPAARKLNDDINAFKVPADYSAVPELIQRGKAFEKESENYGVLITVLIGGASFIGRNPDRADYCAKDWPTAGGRICGGPARGRRGSQRADRCQGRGRWRNGEPHRQFQSHGFIA